MADDAVWVEEVFIWATAWFLDRDIWIVWDTATPECPITFFSGDKGGNGTACPGVPLIIGHHTDTHYQSLKPEGDLVSISLDKSKFTAEITKTMEKIKDAHKRASRGKRKDPPTRPCNGSADVERSIFNYHLEKPGVEAKRMEDGSVEYTCLLCGTQQRQIASHMKKNHSDVLQENELEEFQGRLRKFAQALARGKHEGKRVAEDSEGRRSTIEGKRPSMWQK